MEIKYLGTGAAEGWPGIFCKCDNCRRAVQQGGRNIRTRSQALVDGRLLLDFPADTLRHMQEHGIDFSKVADCLVTHTHSDHLYTDDLTIRRKNFAVFEPGTVFTMYGDASTGKMIKERGITDIAQVNFVQLPLYVSTPVAGYNVTALRADHGNGDDCVFYMIQGEKTMLYAHDTGPFPEEVWQHFEKVKPHFDFVSLDCTYITMDCNYKHLGVGGDWEMRKRMTDCGYADGNTKFCLNHFSHNSGMTYDELSFYLDGTDWIIAYDGMSVEF